MAEERIGGEFPSTLWTDLKGHDDPQRGLETLAARYSRPIHVFLRSALGLGEDEAADHGQGFFAWVIETEFVSKARPERGKFRALLKTALRNYVLDEERRQRAARRGGGRAQASLDDGMGGEAADAAPSPECLLDDRWRREIMTRAVDVTRDRLERAGRGDAFTIFERYFLGVEDELRYADLADEMGVTTTDISNRLMRAKRVYRTALRDIVAETVTDAEELEEELTWLLEGGA